MKTSYKPSKLPAIAAQVRKEHPTSSEIRNYQLDNSFLDEVRQWAKLPKESHGHFLFSGRIFLKIKIYVISFIVSYRTRLNW